MVQDEVETICSDNQVYKKNGLPHLEDNMFKIHSTFVNTQCHTQHVRQKKKSNWNVFNPHEKRNKGDRTKGYLKTQTFYSYRLTHCGIVKPYGEIDSGQHWPGGTKPVPEPTNFDREKFHSEVPSYYIV